MTDTVRSWSLGPALVLETAARAAPALTARFPVGLLARPLHTHPLCSESPASFPFWTILGVQDETPEWDVHTLRAFVPPHLVMGQPFLEMGFGWRQSGMKVASPSPTVYC